MTKIKAATASRYTNETERQTDRQALPAIKARMPVDPYRVISAWNNSLHFCNWRRRVVNLNAIELGSITPIELGNGFKTLVFEVMPYTSLECSLHPISSEQQESRNLNLVQGLNPHSQFDRPVVHRDLKPSNFLLGSDLTAHVSDFLLTSLYIESLKCKNLTHLSISDHLGAKQFKEELWDTFHQAIPFSISS
ncbi:Uncharacterized protein TCM_012790 [Theobroma cacao]|uniref:non-specific serine/threonine protein kinase n=1 Tax=Theobroma cacao TaxID=3641 RepID=A0A061G2Q6_THECC|nr:Uncharacterized protein TCM_012790 [Theobroma cacao]